MSATVITPPPPTDITLAGLTRVAPASGQFSASLAQGITINNALSATRQVNARIAIEDLRSLDGTYSINTVTVANTTAWTVTANTPRTINATSTVHDTLVTLTILYNNSGAATVEADATTISIMVGGAGALPDRTIQIPLRAAPVN